MLWGTSINTVLTFIFVNYLKEKTYVGKTKEMKKAKSMTFKVYIELNLKINTGLGLEERDEVQISDKANS